PAGDGGGDDERAERVAQHREAVPTGGVGGTVRLGGVGGVVWVGGATGAAACDLPRERAQPLAVEFEVVLATGDRRGLPEPGQIGHDRPHPRQRLDEPLSEALEAVVVAAEPVHEQQRGGLGGAVLPRAGVDIERRHAQKSRRNGHSPMVPVGSWQRPAGECRRCSIAFWRTKGPPVTQELPLWAPNLAVFDTETTGIDTSHARVVSSTIALLGPAGEVQERYDWLLDPGVEIPEPAARVHGITTEIARASGIDAAVGVQQIVTQLLEM